MLNINLLQFDIIKFLKKTWLLILTHKKKRKFIVRNINRIVFLRYDRLGDMIVSLPCIHQLRSMFPAAVIDVIASNENEELIIHDETINQVITKPKSLTKWITKLVSLRRKYDLVIDLNHSVAKHTILAIRLLDPRHVLSPYKEGRYGLRGRDLALFDLMPERPTNFDSMAMSEIYLHMLTVFDETLPVRAYKYPLRVKLMALESSLQSSKYLVFNAHGSRAENSLDDETTSQLLKTLVATSVYEKIIWTPGLGRYTRAVKIASEINDSLILVQKPAQDLTLLFSTISSANLVLSVDTAIVHIACGLNTPVIGIYLNKPLLIKQWRPISNSYTKVITSKSATNINQFDIEKLLDSISESEAR